MSSFLETVRQRVVIYDGAMGTGIQERGLTADDFGGPDLEGCNELLVVTRPDLIKELHAEYLAVGVDVIETDTFGGLPVTLGEYGQADRALEINHAAALVAREVASDYSTPDHPRFVAGSIGPGTKFPSLGQIRFAELRDHYRIQAAGLIDGGVDVLIIETMFDLLSIKAAMIGCRRAMAAAGREVPLQVQVTMELTGRMLPGTEIGAALCALDAMRPDVIGINCATGPVEMSEHLRHLSQHARMPISCIPNAGLPSVVDGQMHYDLTPEQLAEHHRAFITELGVEIVGGCCGTTPAHLAAVVGACRDLERARHAEHEAGATSIYSMVPFEQDTSFMIIGERTNANGSKKFREAMLDADWDTTVAMAKDQVKEGAHVLDVCVDYVGRDGAADMDEIGSRFATQSSVPLVLDSTEPQVMEAALQWLGGRAILNSANLEDGEAEGSRLDRVITLAREYGAAVICLAHRRGGPGPRRRVEAAGGPSHPRPGRGPLRPRAGRPHLRRPDLPAVHRRRGPAGRRHGHHRRHPPDQGRAPRRAHHPGRLQRVVRAQAGRPPRPQLGVPARVRRRPASIRPSSTPPGSCRSTGSPRSSARSASTSSTTAAARPRATSPPTTRSRRCWPCSRTSTRPRSRSRTVRDWTVEQRLSQRIIDGDRDGLETDLDQAMAAGTAPLAIINDILLAGMKVVGELFGTGEMQLPFVLQSAETMKTAVAYLEPHMEKDDAGGKGRIVLATVKGDVHDIGKNLVDIILTNNGYEVHNLGIKISILEMIEKAQEVRADAIGMSGLLVKSTLIMRDNLEELNSRGLAEIPVLLGGAALTRTYVERDLREVYDGRLFYGKDAFEGLRVMDRLGEIKRTGDLDPDFGTVPSESKVASLRSTLPRDDTPAADRPPRSPVVEVDNPAFVPPFVGSKVVKGIPLDDIAGYINETALFRNQWQFRPEKGADGSVESDEEFKARIRPTLRSQLAEAKAADMLVPQVVYGYFAANSDGDDLVIWKDDSRSAEWMRFGYPRQNAEPWLCIADFVRPVGSADPDYVAFHIVTMGQRVSDVTARLFAENKYQEYLLVHGLGVEMAEALAEYWHRRVREEWGFADEDGPNLAGLFRQQYRGGRYSWGYPACPDLEDNQKVAELLDAGRIGIEVSEETGFQYQPEQTTSAIILHHPKAKYFVAR